PNRPPAVLITERRMAIMITPVRQTQRVRFVKRSGPAAWSHPGCLVAALERPIEIAILVVRVPYSSVPQGNPAPPLNEQHPAIIEQLRIPCRASTGFLR